MQGKPFLSGEPYVLDYLTSMDFDVRAPRHASPRAAPPTPRVLG